jgi:hypothetical protein
MKGDIIKCWSCGKEFKDTTNQTDKLTKAGNEYQWKGQDSRTGNFKNMCPFCYSTNTENTHEDTTKRQKFIYKGTHRNAESRNVKVKRIKKPILSTEYIASEVLGQREACNVEEERKNFAPSFQRTLPEVEKMTSEELVTFSGGTFDTSPVKSFTPIELMEHKLKAQHKELLSPPDNLKRYKGWRYDKRLKK